MKNTVRENLFRFWLWMTDGDYKLRFKWWLNKVRWWFEDRRMWDDYHRWIRFLKKCEKMGTPTSIKDYDRIHRMFVKTSKKCKDWCVAVGAFGDCAYPFKAVERMKDASVKEVYDMFLCRLSYFTDRMGWVRWLELTAYLNLIECRLLGEE